MRLLTSITTFRSRLERKKRRKDIAQDAPSKSMPSLEPTMYPRVRPDHHRALPEQGWTTITFNTPSDGLYDASQSLFQASKAFFDLPQSQKQKFETQEGSEDGWSRVEGEKELITLRTSGGTPDVLKVAAINYWAEAGRLLNEILARIAESLGLSGDSLTRYSMPCGNLGQERTATLLRLFRYEGVEGTHSRTVAEAHRDLGLLSLVVGDKPGLEVWDKNRRTWFPIERSYTSPAASLLVGRQLEWLSNQRYASGGHLVRSYPDVPSQNAQVTGKQYRYSIVFVLRAHSPVPVNTDDLTTKITGPFANPLRDVTALDLYREISAAHFNINTGLQEREEQRQKLARKKENYSRVTMQ